MTASPLVLVVGGSGRTGARTLQQLLARGCRVRAIVRPAASLPAAVAADPALERIDAALLSLDDDALRRHVEGCTAVVSCLGHTISLRGVFGPPRDLVTRATTRLCRAIEASNPAAAVAFVLMSSVSVHRARALDPRRTRFERMVLWLLRRLVPPVEDNQRAAQVLLQTIGADHPRVHWVVVRPDALRDGEVGPYTVHEALVDPLFSPWQTRMANVAHFIATLATEPEVLARWRGRCPVIVDARPG
ncbi:MAG: SDR family oxidoreductase [Nannocystaceae bacterium]|nr:SDR family oxidoreductase [Nannocystaceae bacterium]